MPRSDFERFLATFAPAVVQELPEPDPPWQRTGRQLPVYVDTQHGARIAVTTFDAD